MIPCTIEKEEGRPFVTITVYVDWEAYYEVSGDAADMSAEDKKMETCLLECKTVEEFEKICEEYGIEPDRL